MTELSPVACLDSQVLLGIFHRGFRWVCMSGLTSCTFAITRRTRKSQSSLKLNSIHLSPSLDLIHSRWPSDVWARNDCWLCKALRFWGIFDLGGSVNQRELVSWVKDSYLELFWLWFHISVVWMEVFGCLASHSWFQWIKCQRFVIKLSRRQFWDSLWFPSVTEAQMYWYQNAHSQVNIADI
jgi:hypothetical protein